MSKDIASMDRGASFCIVSTISEIRRISAIKEDSRKKLVLLGRESSRDLIASWSTSLKGRAVSHQMSAFLSSYKCTTRLITKLSSSRRIKKNNGRAFLTAMATLIDKAFQINTTTINRTTRSNNMLTNRERVSPGLTNNSQIIVGSKDNTSIMAIINQTTGDLTLKSIKTQDE